MLRPYNEWAMNRENRAQKEKGQNRVKPQFYPRITIPQPKHFASVIFRKFYAPGRPGAALTVDTGQPEWSAYSGALGGKFPRLDAFLKEKESTAKKSS